MVSSGPPARARQRMLEMSHGAIEFKNRVLETIVEGFYLDQKVFVMNPLPSNVLKA